MTRKFLMAIAAVLALGGCIVHNDGGGGDAPLNPGNITFSWKFGGYTCAQAYVASVAIDIPGETLANQGLYPCTAEGYDGVVLTNFAGGNYTFSIRGLGLSGETLYTGSGSFVVNGNTNVNVDLTPTNPANSWAYLTWRFPANSVAQSPTCAQAGAKFVDVSIDNGAWSRYTCEQGQTSPGAQTPYLLPGNHTISLLGVDQTGYAFYRADSTLQTFAGQAISADYQLGWAIGGVAISWNLTNGSTGETCASSGITTVSVNFQNTATGQWIYGQVGDPQSCVAAPISYDALQAGTYIVSITATGPNNAVYASNSTTPPAVQIQAGVWANPNNPLNVTLYKIQ